MSETVVLDKNSLFLIDPLKKRKRNVSNKAIKYLFRPISISTTTSYGDLIRLIKKNIASLSLVFGEEVKILVKEALIKTNVKPLEGEVVFYKEIDFTLKNVFGASVIHSIYKHKKQTQALELIHPSRLIKTRLDIKGITLFTRTGKYQYNQVESKAHFNKTFDTTLAEIINSLLYSINAFSPGHDGIKSPQELLLLISKVKRG